MTISPQQLDSVPDRVVALFSALDDEMRIAAVQGIIANDGPRRVRAAISRASVGNRRKITLGIRDAIRDTARYSLTKDEALYERARVAGLIGAYTPIERAPYVSAIVNRGVLNAQTLGNIVRTSAEERVYGEFVSALDTAALRVATAQASPQTAIREAVKQIATMTTQVTYVSESGKRITSALYPAVRRNVLTTAAQTTARLTMSRAAEVGIGTFQVSAHMGARPEHAEWQGGIYTAEELVSVCGYGDELGLAGINCRHQMYPFVVGISEPSFADIDSSENAEHYELSQRQRLAERNIRGYKSRANVYREAERAATDPEVAAALKAYKDAATAKVRKWQNERSTVAAKRGGKVQGDREVATIR